MKAHPATFTATIIIATMVAGCAPDGTLTGLNTSSINQEAAMAQPTADPACVTLASQIDALNQEGVGDKVSKAAAKKYKMKSGDLTKADALNKAHAEFQTKCSSYPPSPVVAAAEPAPAAAKTSAKPPVPSPKPVASAMMPQGTPTASVTAGPDSLAQQQTPTAQP
jgi:hypothetical protein